MSSAGIAPTAAGGFEDVRRVNDTVLLIRIPPCPRYSIDASETVRISLLPSTLRSAYSLARHDEVVAEVVIAPSASTGAVISGGSLLAVRGCYSSCGLPGQVPVSTPAN